MSLNRSDQIPRGTLGKFVERFWLYDSVVSAHAQEKILPTATTELVLDLGGGLANSSAALVIGPHSEHWVLDTSRAAAVIGVHFRPGGAFPFFGVPADELHNVRVPLDALWGLNAASLVDQVLAQSSPAVRFEVLESVLLKAARTLARHPAVGFALRKLSVPFRQHRITHVAGAVGMSQRRFLERFRGEVGMAPKVFARVKRFQAVVETAENQREVNWAHVASDCGYFDQAHFVHDFRAFSGFTPNQYLALKGAHLNHVPVAR